MSQSRQEGYYWVKYDGDYLIGYWGMKYNNMSWTLTFSNGWIYEDSDLEHINENRIKEPGELPD